jgi:hypothetical protein
MKIFLSLLGFSFLSVCLVRAQVTVEVVLEDDYFLPGESFVTGVRITNLSGQTLKLGKEPDWLAFSIEARDNFTVPTLGDVPVTGEFEVESTTAATKRVDLAPYYQLTIPGRYRSRPMSNLQWQQELASKPKSFVITSGRIVEQEFGVPQNPSGAHPLKLESMRSKSPRISKKKTLRSRDRCRGDKIYRVFPVGVFVSPSRPNRSWTNLVICIFCFRPGRVCSITAWLTLMAN